MALAAALPTLGVAQQVQVKLDPAKTQIEWVLGDVLHTVHGTFKMMSGIIQFDPRTGEAGGQVIVDAASGDSGNKMRNSKMNKEVLESARFPEITFIPRHVSGYIAGQENFTVQIAGNFTIHGGTHEITLSVPISIKNTTLEGSTSFPIPYDAWGMKNPSTLFLKVEKTVQISIKAVGDVQSAGKPLGALSSPVLSK
jgi:polyisoprenoid-binding protein YceI